MYETVLKVSYSLLLYLLIVYNIEPPTFNASKNWKQQPDVEAAQWIELNMQKFLCCVVSRKKGSNLCKSSREFLELLHWKSTGAWLCGLMLHLCLVGITVRTVQGNRLEIHFNSFEAMKMFWAKLPLHFGHLQSSFFHTERTLNTLAFHCLQDAHQSICFHWGEFIIYRLFQMMFWCVSIVLIIYWINFKQNNHNIGQWLADSMQQLTC